MAQCMHVVLSDISCTWTSARRNLRGYWVSIFHLLQSVSQPQGGGDGVCRGATSSPPSVRCLCFVYRYDPSTSITALAFPSTTSGRRWPGSSSQDQRLGAMGWQGLTSRAVKEKVAPPNINTAQQLNNWTINRFTVPVCIRVPIVCEVFACVCNHWAPGRVAFRLKATPVKIRIFTLYPLLPHGFYIKVCQYATIIRGGVRNVYARLWILSRNQFRFLARRWYNVASTL